MTMRIGENVENDVEGKRRKSRVWDVKHKKMRYESEWESDNGMYEYKLVLDLQGRMSLACTASGRPCAYHVQPECESCDKDRKACHQYHQCGLWEGQRVKDGIHIGDSVVFQDQFILMFSTGRRDKNRMTPRMIFESDLIRHERGRLYLVEYWSTQWHVGFDLRQISREPGRRYIPVMQEFAYPVWESDKWRIIGNRYEDPDLLLEADEPEEKARKRDFVLFTTAMNLARFEIREIEKDPDMEPMLLKIRMNTIYHNLVLASLIGYDGGDQKERYEDIKYTFIGFQKDHGFAYDNDPL